MINSTTMHIGIQVQGINSEDIAKVESVIRQIFALLLLIKLGWQTIVAAAMIIETILIVTDGVIFITLRLPWIVKYRNEIYSIIKAIGELKC